MKPKQHSIDPIVRRDQKQNDRPLILVHQSNSRLVSLRHHPAVWLVPTALLLLAILPWPYGFYNLLRLAVCAVSAWLAYEQWKHDNAASGWMVALSAVALLYNPVIPIHLTREIWIVLNLISAGVFLGHLWVLKNKIRI